MENKINIAELLKDCPSGMELYSPMYGLGILTKVTDRIHVKFPKEHNVICFRCDGKVSEDGEIMLYPKGKTTWEGFKPPCKFKDGDIVTYKYENGLVSMILNKFVNLTIAGAHYQEVHYHCALYDNAKGFVTNNYIVGEPKYTHLATEEEKAKLFQTIKDNGYKWNAETKTLEKLEYIEDKGNISDGYHTFNELYEYRLLYNASMFNELAKQGLYDVHKSRKHSDGAVPFGDDNWFIVQAELPTGQISNHYEMKDWELFKVPEKEKANPYDGHTPQDVAKRLRDFLTLEKLVEPKFKVGDIIQDEDGYKVKITEVNVADECYGYESIIAKGIGGISFKEQNNWELVPNKFDINTLMPFDKVLVRVCDTAKWFGDFYLWYDDTEKDFPYNCVGGTWSDCIPYESNEHLLGTTDDCDKFYKTWE